MHDLSDKTSVFFGALNEVALGVAAALHRAGSRIVLAPADGPPEAVEAAARALAAPVHPVDLDDPAVLAGQVAALPAFHVAVFSPGWDGVGEFMDTTPSDWDEAFRQNFERLVYAAQAAARVLVRRGGGGRLIFLSSAFSLMPFLQTSVTGTTLAALGALARMAAVDLGAHGITVNVVARGWVEADGARRDLGAEGRSFVEAGIPLGRIGRAEDVGDVCAFLASDAARYVTGAILPVDGGYTLTRAAGTSPYPQPS
jgi:NAD(P)-dependent dehydrogenase (short-subunit alcohol dehydrogenase family)